MRSLWRGLQRRDAQRGGWIDCRRPDQFDPIAKVRHLLLAASLERDHGNHFPVTSRLGVVAVSLECSIDLGFDMQPNPGASLLQGAQLLFGVQRAVTQVRGHQQSDQADQHTRRHRSADRGSSTKETGIVLPKANVPKLVGNDPLILLS